ncbi:protein-glutamate methylesterase/protein-glutamine glutaminase [Blastochloris tepida]|jgi:two-component system chemotaxis response regulator CheB|uniref:Protein-glutamate methylesterase/protein-glutamine glutaminase n=1 Tax=Blastochloris tepida TaxID=2233851 RepID=A0A348FWI1_9HYPH|nr:chemotaxis response regulator protein-glutamate methylesterase [Blastochloris tepida]BBF91664.1 chemotaxis response regulator protein-glutamate methylesterase of group 2 operon [Blastochloris tepida]
MTATAPILASTDQPIRVMIVDDAVVVRGLVSRWLAEETGVEVVASLRNGREAVDQFNRYDPDVVVLDIEMPELDGISTLPLLLEKKRDLIVIMASTLTRRNAEISLKALSLGAADYIPKPETNRDVTTSTTFRRELVDKIKSLAARRRRTAPRPAPAVAPVAGRPAAPPLTPRLGPLPADIRLRPFPPTPPRVIAIGSSTGGPQALQVVLKGLAPIAARFPIIITQHMPPTFTTILAEHLGRASGRPAHEGIDGEPITAGTIYVAPGGRHMVIKRVNNVPVIGLEDGPPVNYCKPAVDPLFASAADAYGAGLLAVVLTGMGSDGAHGAGDVVAHGGGVIAQDEATSVVWGMPGATAHSGVCSAVLPLNDIAPRIIRLASGDRL